MDKDRYDFNKHVSTYLVDQTKFADTKAAAGIALSGFFLKFGLDAYVPNSRFITDKLDLWGIIIMGIGIVLYISVYFPNTASSKKGVIFWGDIAGYKTFPKYKNELAKVSDYDEELSRQNFYLSIVANSKFGRFKYGMMISILGAIFVLIKLISKYMFPA